MLKIVYTHGMGSDTRKIQTLRGLQETSRLPMYGFSPTVQKVWSVMLSLKDGGLGSHDVILVTDWFLMMSKSQSALRPVYIPRDGSISLSCFRQSW